MRFLPGSLLSAIVALFLVLGLGLMAQLDRKKDSYPNDSQALMTPPPLEDLGKDYKVRLVYFVPTDR